MTSVDDRIDPMPGRERPGCVTVYAVLLWLLGGLYLVGSLLVILASLLDSDFVLFFLALFGLLLAAIPIVIALGLWKMKAWAWYVVVIVQSIGILGGLLSLGTTLLGAAASEGGGYLAFPIVGNLIGLFISGVILYWFITNRKAFGIGAPSYRLVEGPDGEMIQQPVAASGTGGIGWIILGIAAVFFLVPVCVIIVLALLGPAIGNVFSNIVMGI